MERFPHFEPSLYPVYPHLSQHQCVGCIFQELRPLARNVFRNDRKLIFSSLGLFTGVTCRKRRRVCVYSELCEKEQQARLFSCARTDPLDVKHFDLSFGRAWFAIYAHTDSVFDNVWDINRDMLPKRPRHTVHTRIDVVILCCLIGHALLNRWLYCSQ